MAYKANSVNMDDAKLRRKLNKPLVEKKRRERINKYLYELHGLLTDVDQTTPASKLEKADILEMAVSHIRNLKHKLRNKALEAAAANQIEQSQRLQEVISPKPQLHVRIPSPPNSNCGSMGYPSPTPSLESTSQDTRLPITIIIPQQPQTQLIQAHCHINNTRQPRSVRYQPYQLPKAIPSHIPHHITNNPAHICMQSNLENIKPKTMWRPW